FGRKPPIEERALGAAVAGPEAEDEVVVQTCRQDVLSIGCESGVDGAGMSGEERGEDRGGVAVVPHRGFVEPADEEAVTVEKLERGGWAGEEGERFADRLAG